MAWSHWNTKRLQPKSMNREKETDKKRVVLIKEGKVQKNGKLSFFVFNNYFNIDSSGL